MLEKVWKKGNPPTLLVGIEPDIATIENSIHVCVCVCVLVCAQSWLTLCNPLDYSLPGTSVHRIFQVRLLEWVAVSFSRGSSRDQIRVSCVSCIRGQVLYH